MKIQLFTSALLLMTGMEWSEPVTAQVPIIPDSSRLFAPFSEQDVHAFAQPDRVFYPETWFHYIGGNVSYEGITADLEAISKAGFSGIQLFHGKFGSIWPGNHEQILCLSPKWDQLVKHTAEECRRLGLRFTMQGCPGWAMAGGPWIEPANAMRHLTYTRTDITGGSKVTLTLPIQVSNQEPWRDYRDVTVLAFPTPEGDTGQALQPKNVTSQTEAPWLDCLSGNLKSPIPLAATSETDWHWIDVELATPSVVRTIELPSINSMSHPWCFDPQVRVRVEACDSEGVAQPILETELPQGNWQDNQPVSLSCCESAPTRHYRIGIRNRHAITLGSIRLWEAARKNNWEAEAGWTLRARVRTGDTIQHATHTYLQTNQVVDLTRKMQADGTLTWKAPDGKWTILRIGHVNTGAKNGPAPDEATGWECDKLAPAGAESQYSHYIGRLASGPLQQQLLQGVLFDSWECMTQTWTPAMEQDFRKATGYDLRHWMPALFGYVVESPEKTARFLNDWRQTINDLLVHNFFGRMSQLAHAQGLPISYETASGDVFPADILEYFKYADVPMCEFWQPLSDHFVGSTNFKPIKPTVSAAHIYGKPRVAAEAFTSFEHTWDEHWQMLKEVANLKSIDGISHLVFHTYTHNPQVNFLQPGTSFSGANIGTPFLRGQTWWKYMPAFTGYLARCSYLLERGKPVNDVLWYLGDEMDHKPDQNAPFPTGFRYDYANRDVLVHRLAVDQGAIVTPEGVRYALLWMPETTRMYPETLERLYTLIQQGATVLANPPRELATLTGGSAQEARFQKAIRQLWGEGTTEPSIRTIGQGRLVTGYTLDEALQQLAYQPDVTGPELLWSHRQTAKADWYMVAAPAGKSVEGAWSFRNQGHVQIWDPQTGEVRDAVYRKDQDRTVVWLSLPEASSCFVVFRKDITGQSAQPNNPVWSSKVALTNPWTLHYPAGWGAPDTLQLQQLKPWCELPLSEEAKAFSGTVEYQTTFTLDALPAGQHCRIDLGKVDMMAEVQVNGQPATLLWSAPYEADITPWVKAGVNTLTIRVTSSWYNRLVYDAGQPETARKTWVLRWPDAQAPLRPTGLMGPVQLHWYEY